MGTFFKKRMHLVPGIVFIFFFLILSVQADPQKVLEKTTEKEFLFNDEEQSPIEEISIGDMGKKMMISLVIVLILILGTLYLIRRYYSGSLPMREQKMKLVKVIEKVYLSPKQTIVLLWTIDRILVVANNNGQMSLLSEIKDKNTLEEKIPQEFTDVLTQENIQLSKYYQA